MAVNASGEGRRTRLTEVIVVASFVVLGVIAIGIPLIGRLKEDRLSNRAAENLKACGQALLVYAEDWGGVDTGLPVGPAGLKLLATEPTCDPEDFWPNGCRRASIAPLAGSFAYVRGTKFYAKPENWKRYLAGRPNATLLIDPFRSRSRIAYFTGDVPPSGFFDVVPFDMMRYQADGSIIRRTSNRQIEYFAFNWPVAFWLGQGVAGIPSGLVTPMLAPVAPAPPRPKHKKPTT